MPTAGLLPLPNFVAFDQNGNPLSGGLVYTQVPGGGPPKTVWADAAETIPLSYPVVLNADGAATIYGSGAYFIQTTDALGNQIPAFTGASQDLLGGFADTISPSLANIAALRAVTATTFPFDQAFVLGYRTPADGGEGQFIVQSGSTAGDDSGIIIVDASGRRWHRAASGGMASVKWFGAFGNGISDDDGAVQAAVNAVQATGGTLYVPAGSYSIANTIVISNSIQILGCGMQGDTNFNAATGYTAAVFVCSPSVTCFAIRTNAAVTMQGFQIVYQTRPIAGTAGITLDTDGTSTLGFAVNYFSVFRDLHILGADTAFICINAVAWNIERCVFQGYYANGVLTNCTNAAGDGDNVITGCTFTSGNCSLGGHVQIGTSGGMRIVNNKFSGACLWGVKILTTGAVTSGAASPTLIQNNSMESLGTLGEAILAQRAPGASAQIGSLIVTGNEIANCFFGVSVQGAPSAPALWVSGLLVASNIIIPHGDGVTPGTCVSVDGTEDANIVGNIFRTDGAGPVTGVQVGPNVINIVQSVNVRGAGVV